jgi:cytochrome oxidase Cu insertion factor (SCO1/SenC/PrrC family)
MKRIIAISSLVMLLTAVGFAQTNPVPPSTHLKVGMAAPEFTLNDTAGKPVKLSDFKGKKNVVLAFYVLAFTGG